MKNGFRLLRLPVTVMIVLMPFLSVIHCYSQNTKAWTIDISWPNHTGFYNNLGMGIYARHPDTSYIVGMIDTFDYIIIRDSNVIKQGKINRFITIDLQEFVKEGDIVTYYNFKCKNKDIILPSKRASLTFKVPFFKWFRKD